MSKGNPQNFAGLGVTPEAERRREMTRSHQAVAQPKPFRGTAPLGPLSCPECTAIRTIPETLRVHRWLAHDVRESA